MPQGKGNDRKKAPNKNFTRADGLPLSVQRLLLLACEEQGLADESAAKVCESNVAFGHRGSKLRDRCRSKVRYYRKLREEEPEAYW